MSSLMPRLDRVTRLFWRSVGRPVDLAGAHAWLDAPMHAGAVIGDGDQRAAGWIRTLRSTGEYVYSGCYSSRSLPGADRPSVHVTFPLEEGNVQVFLRPRVLPGGDLELASPVGRFGTDGAYVVVRVGGEVYAARAPIHETFRVYLDPDGVLRTDHDLRMWAATAVRLHYKLERRA